MSHNLQLKSKIRDILIDYHRSLRVPKLTGELDFINRTVSFFNSKSASHGNASFFSRSGNIDKSPLVCFHHPTPNQCPATKEIADILLVSKLIKYGRLVEKRAVLLQSKFTPTPNLCWKGIDTAQFFLISNWPAFFRVKPGPISGPYVLKPDSLLLGAYAFVGPNVVSYPIYFSPSAILGHLPNVLSQQTFTFSPTRVNGYQTSSSFLMRLILNQIGEDVRANPVIDTFIDELYQVVGLSLDPPDEFKWAPQQNEDKPEGFGMVEFTRSVNEE